MAMDIDTIPNLLGDQREQAPEELQPYFIEFEDFWERKLWHELTHSLVGFFNEPQSAPQRIPLYENFIKSFAGKINQLKLVTLGLKAASQVKGWSACVSSMTHMLIVIDPQERLKFISSLAEKVNKPASQDAYVHATVEAANIQLKLGEYDAARKKLDECEKILDTFDSVETVVHAAFYGANAEYFKVSCNRAFHR